MAVVLSVNLSRSDSAADDVYTATEYCMSWLLVLFECIHHISLLPSTVTFRLEFEHAGGDI